ncbi:hypothetical protein [Thermoactinospora rubra]|uniref:hypothetical protein n=1 Tax=Thermoactinospora rubra TaxID=1088767 RepID=UPI001301E40A|nr:hypothetical protein [Thermoactinospora rubra]
MHERTDRPRRVVVVEDDDISRRGMASLLADHPRVRVVAALDHGRALEWAEEWSAHEVDLAIVDAADERRRDDQFPGVAVVEAIRRHRTAGQTRIMVVTGHFFDDALRRRMREARADLFYHRAQLADVAVLYEAVLAAHPVRPAVPGPVDPESMARLGVSRVSTVNRAVAYALDHGIPDRLAVRDSPRSRAWLRLRRDFNAHARLTPVTRDGRVPDRPQDMPSVTQIARFLAWATRVKPGRPDA